jgi:hypothetical protein
MSARVIPFWECEKEPSKPAINDRPPGELRDQLQKFQYFNHAMSRYVDALAQRTKEPPKRGWFLEEPGLLQVFVTKPHCLRSWPSFRRFANDAENAPTAIPA